MTFFMDVFMHYGQLHHKPSSDVTIFFSIDQIRSPAIVIKDVCSGLTRICFRLGSGENKGKEEE